MSLWLASRCLASPRFAGAVRAASKWSRGIARRRRRQGGAAQREMRAHVLAERAAFAAFPRLEVAASCTSVQRLVVLAGLVVERAQFDAQVVALLDQVEALLQFAQPLRRRFAEALPELVALVEQPGVVRIRPEGALVGGAGLGRFAAGC